MKIKSILFCLITCSLVITSCSVSVDQAPEVNMDGLTAEIQAVEDAYAKAWNAKDLEAVAALYADDAVSMPNNEAVVSGKDAIFDRLKKNMASDTSNSTEAYMVDDLMVAGDYVIEAGKSISTGSNGEKTTGKYIAIWTKRDGKYVCVRDIWNSDAPKKSE